MRISVISDLHLELGDYYADTPACDLIVIAGDLSTKLNGLKWLRTANFSQPVIYVPGNHEYYGDKLPALDSKILQELADSPHIHFLNNRTVDIHGFRIFGSTFWTDMRLFDNQYLAAESARSSMADFKRIRLAPSYRKMRPTDFQALNAQAQLHMRESFIGIPHNRRICVTHHSPSARSLPGDRVHDKVSCAYASNLDHIVAEIAPLAWFHGHIHSSSNYLIGQTSIICNPRGYVDELNPLFDPHLVIDTDILEASIGGRQ